MSDENADSAPMRLFCSDIDGTLLGKADAARAFEYTWEALPEESRPLLVYNTGRLLDDLQRLIKKGRLLKPDYAICGVGTVVYDFKNEQHLKDFSVVLEEGWDRAVAEEVVREVLPNATKQPDHYQTPYKSSWYVNMCGEETIASLEEHLKARELATNIVYSSGRDLDVLPKFADKGNALSWLLKHLEIPRKQCLVAGDSGNDTAMFLKRGVRGIVVANAQPELLERTVGRPEVYRAEGFCADGVLEGLIHFGVIENIIEGQPGEAMDHAPEIQHLLQEEKTSPLGERELRFIREGYEAALDGLRRNITPKGFSACSLEDNSTTGTDANYRSVWARDGSITICGTIELEDEDIRQCQRATLETLLSCVSPPGQIPANVNLDTGQPDYSGVGGICSIDSGLWVVIAFAEYIRKTQDYGFLRDHMEVLQKVMDWLSAQDSNNDALLEIPEAGDWTDLFGRSYHVLVDEVLWFRANIAFGRLLETLGDWQRAGDYLRWAGTIKKAILRDFWPSTRMTADMHYTFADSQLGMGDTSYLLAQITPFDHDWRCDILGNCLASLFNVLDHDRAQTALRFMWGSGVNEPFPAANLYPVVQAGDPNWKSYYTVNLLNLPHHYHNGGIWPFVGGIWVRFLNRLGLHDLACDQLVKLAELNKTGVHHEWEFNEWAHGTTGKPMGKAYQAWSCSEFIAACLELNLWD